MTSNRAFTEPDHFVIWDHSGRCWHEDPDDEDGPGQCDPYGAWMCHAPPDSYCLYGCVKCEEGWSPNPSDPSFCEAGHRLLQHHCWVLPWVENMEASETYVGKLDRHVDGPIVVVEWSSDYLTWKYWSETLPSSTA